MRILWVSYSSQFTGNVILYARHLFYRYIMYLYVFILIKTGFRYGAGQCFKEITARVRNILYDFVGAFTGDSVYVFR